MDVKVSPLERLRRLISPTKDQKGQGKKGEFEETLAKENGEGQSSEEGDPGKGSDAGRHPLFENPEDASRSEKKPSRSRTVDGKGLKVNVLA